MLPWLDTSYSLLLINDEKWELLTLCPGKFSHQQPIAIAISALPLKDPSLAELSTLHEQLHPSYFF